MPCRARARASAGDDIAARMWTGIKTFVGMDDKISLPTAYSFEQHVEAAVKFREHMDQDCDRAPCAVCSKYTHKTHLTRHRLQDVPNIDLLDSTLPGTPQLPREALTTFVWNCTTYCMQPAACHVDEALLECSVDVCKDCHADLKAGRVPCTSLVAFDTGERNWRQAEQGWQHVA